MINFYQKNSFYGIHCFGWLWIYDNLQEYIIKNNILLKENIDFHPWIDNLHSWGQNEDKFINSNNKIVCFQHLPYNSDHDNRDDFANFMKIMNKKVIDRIDLLFVLSESNKTKIIKDYSFLKDKVIFIKHPKVKSYDLEFNLKNLDNDCINIIHAGVFERDVGIFFRNFKNSYFKKYIIVKGQKKESEIINGITHLKDLPDEDYIKFITSGVIFNYIAKASANNLILECIIYNIPVIVNKLDAIVDYLGNDYPLYYKNESELKELINNKNEFKNKCISAYYYLKNLNKEDISVEYFNKKIVNYLEKYKV